MEALSTSEQVTRIYNHFSNGWTGETYTGDSGKVWKITTLKTYSGSIVSTASIVEILPNGSMTWSFGNKSINLIRVKARATEKTIREQHAKALILFDENEEVKEFTPSIQFEIKVGQRVFLDGYGKGQHNGNEIIYDIEFSDWGTSYKTIDTNTLELSSCDHLRNFNDKFGIGTYYIEGDIFKGSTDDLNNLVIEAQTKKRADQEAEKIRIEAENVEYQKRIEEGKKAVNIPDWAKSVIVAEMYQNDSDSQSDYFSTSVSAVVILAYSKTDKNNMQELKKACLNFEGTEKFAEDSEFEQKDSSGSYIPAYCLGTSSWSGWKVSKQKYNFDLTTETGKNQIYLAHSENRYFVNENEEPTPEQPNFEAVPVEAGSVQIIDYSEKAIAVIGDTKPIKDQLKDLGGRFNFRLSCGAGWIFPKTKLTEVQAIFN